MVDPSVLTQRIQAMQALAHRSPVPRRQITSPAEEVAETHLGRLLHFETAAGQSLLVAARTGRVLGLWPERPLDAPASTEIPLCRADAKAIAAAAAHWQRITQHAGGLTVATAALPDSFDPVAIGVLPDVLSVPQDTPAPSNWLDLLLGLADAYALVQNGETITAGGEAMVAARLKTLADQERQDQSDPTRPEETPEACRIIGTGGDPRHLLFCASTPDLMVFAKVSDTRLNDLIDIWARR